LPDQLFYNTGLSTYVWIITNNKRPERRGKVQLIDATAMFEKMRRSLGDKRNLIADPHIAEITRLFGNMAGGENSNIFDNEDFGYWRITVERPLRLNLAVTPERIAVVQEQSAFRALVTSRKKGTLAEEEIVEGEALQDSILEALHDMADETIWKNRDAFADHLRAVFRHYATVHGLGDLKPPTSIFKAILAGLSERDETADICRGRDGEPEPDAELRDFENVPLKETIQSYFDREVKPHVPDAWIDDSKTKKGYEIPFTRHFYRYVPPRPLEEIDADLARLSAEIQEMLRGVAA